MKIGKGMIIGIIGGLLSVVGVFLPWMAFSVGGQDLSFSGIQLGTLAATVPQAAGWAIFPYGILAFGILGLILCLIPKKVTGILALVFGLLVTLLALVAYASISPITLIGGSVGVGIWLSVVGGIILLLGGLMAFMDAKKAGTMAAPMAAPPPPM